MQMIKNHEFADKSLNLALQQSVIISRHFPKVAEKKSFLGGVLVRSKKSQLVTYSATVLHPSEMAFLENLADKEGFLGGVFHEPLPASPQYILHTDNTSVSSATSSPLSVINTGQFPPFSWGAQQQHSSKPVCQGGKPAAAPPPPPSLSSTSLPPPPPSPPYSPACPASLLLCLPSGSSCQESAFCSSSKREGEGPA